MRTFVVGLPACTDGHPRSAQCAYQVAWSINPHMVIGSADPGRALRQHAAFVRVLERHGAHVMTLPFVHGAYDSIFAKDAAILVAHDDEHRALLAQPRFSVRRVERIARARHLAALGFEIDRSVEHPLEGGDVIVLPDGSSALLGHGFRSSSAAAPTVARFLGIPVITLELVDPSLAHLDTALTVLADGTALVCEAAFTRAALDTIDGLFDTVIQVSRTEAAGFALNVIELDQAVITGADAPQLATALRATGREVVTVELDEFHRSGGSVGCLVSPIHHAAQARFLEREDEDHDVTELCATAA